ncbi:hypothetical protein AVEN_164037-1 [Araneus ventricosus]|uniref:Uncharacterized protein n=1 Tax=Araneus ventricosus TaxID=182803 RepID=A0A4Y2KP30_ARAVE|nr:hypothetical protein AVEN_155910-1 [Araneus ventricosus]GBN02021.1 hypothetical protein AVEN_167819-1 [Araneus ventricosus]GBN03729.1 hypothetical protein AVEN_47641-1 [Araneus ventricosus]GBN03750.1 hypothetical protein AVEN_164037-1 [Araneus ventricosus]
MGCCTLGYTLWAEGPPAGVLQNFGELMTAPVSSQSSDRGSKLRCTSQNNPSVAGVSLVLHVFGSKQHSLSEIRVDSLAVLNAFQDDYCFSDIFTTNDLFDIKRI